MKSYLQQSWQRKTTLSLVIAAMAVSAPVHADEREDLEKLRATVLSLIDTLVKNRILPKAQADLMMRDAEARANNRLAQAPAPEINADGKKIVRVPYVPDAVKIKMRDEIKAEVLAETRNSGLGPLLAADGQGRIQLEGDLRIRAETTKLDSGNTSAQSLALNANSALVSRAPDPGSFTATSFKPNFNLTDDVGRTRIRARAGINAKVSDSVTAGFSVATGNTTGPTSTNQTIAQGSANNSGFFNKYPLLVDRAYIKFDPTRWSSVSAGRFRNPFVSTDLVWADDLNFEGIAATLNPKFSDNLSVFATAGWFPLTTQVPNQISRRSMVGFQAGFDWQIGVKDNHLKFAAALYGYNNIEGRRETLNAATAPALPPDYGVRSEYASGYRQRGNTLFAVNAADTTPSKTPIWGLASSFKVLNLTSSFDLVQFDPVHVILTGDLVYNLGFKKSEIKSRTGIDVSDGSGLGFLGRVLVGAPRITKAGEWNASIAYRYLGSDAVLDAFTNSDFGLGGTNNKGTIIGASYGIANNTWLSVRWLSSDLIDSLVPTANGSSFKTKLSTDVIQLDLNTKF